MPEEERKFKNKFRIKTARMEGFDYGLGGSYFVTICTKDKKHWFGDVQKEKMELSEMGKIADECWREIPKHFPFVSLADFVVMPNHVHGIIIIDNFFRQENSSGDREIGGMDYRRRDAINRVSTTGEIYCEKGGITGKHNPMLKENLSTIIRWYKGRTKFEISRENKLFQWQPRFYDRIIRNEIEFEKMRKYIFDNPLNWEIDKNNSVF